VLKVTTQEMIDKLVEITQRYGDLPVVVYVSDKLRFEVDAVAACSERDHTLITLGSMDLG
jgi:hypothetical protein